MLLANKVAIITGGAQGIGEATALKFSKEGAKVAICDVNETACKAVADAIIKAGGEALSFKVDVTDAASVQAMVAAVMAKWGRVDSLVNNAGITSDAQLKKMTDEQFDRVININLKGTYNCTRAVVDIMLNQGSGSITNASSIVGVYGNFGQTNYAATKWAVIGMAKTWAKELGPKGIRCNAVAPGFIATEMTDALDEKTKENYLAGIPLKRLGSGDDVANTCVFLASDMGAYITGQVISVCGGLNT